ncbi:uncharacterized protein ISCGN_004977 [Ixodes scapularis]
MSHRGFHSRQVLDCLGHALAQTGPAISFLFHPEVDLTETVTRKTRDDISGQIKGIVSKLWLSPDQCYKLVLKNPRKCWGSSDIVVGDVGTRENEPNSGRPLTVSLSLPFDHAERDLNANLKPQLQSIYASLKLNSEVTATNVTILNSLLDDILVQMKRKDPLFHLLFKRLEFTGSYNDGLRIKKADEFDIDLVLNLPFEKDEFTIRLRQHGPAVTLHIKLKNGNQIDVDLVPVIEFRHPSWPTGVQKKGWMANMLPEDCNWFLIPKPPMSMPKSHLWRLHFPNMEKRLIEDKGCVKPIIRLLKAMRDSYGWNLSSYSLKTFVMSQVLENDDAQYWHPDNQGMLFVRVLDCLGHALAQPGPAISFSSTRKWTSPRRSRERPGITSVAKSKASCASCGCPLTSATSSS